MIFKHFFVLAVPSLLSYDHTIDRMVSKWTKFTEPNTLMEEECRVNIFRKSNDIYLTPELINYMIQLAEEMVDQLKM